MWLFLGRDANGKQIRRSEVNKGTKTDAEKGERELRRALDTATFVDAKAGTVAEFMLRWLESISEKSERCRPAEQASFELETWRRGWDSNPR